MRLLMLLCYMVVIGLSSGAVINGDIDWAILFLVYGVLFNQFRIEIKNDNHTNN